MFLYLLLSDIFGQELIASMRLGIMTCDYLARLRLAVDFIEKESDIRRALGRMSRQISENGENTLVCQSHAPLLDTLDMLQDTYWAR